ncbi:MAG: ABC transporter ATP-binding protein/permease [Erysipelotrichaceae bacterium]|nr:ABC transporter ATP-binding protein/permease [Erysipelotrichaceae bacterium]
MIELKDVKKTYKSKKGISTEALKGINIKFGEKGLTFILGKSGSGKSTLLNLLGGLDTYSSGDIIVNGRSTKQFKEKDWDAYRNTYMGFVFQEFNLLDNYNIEDNIKLALELQHKKSSRAEIINALQMVDLDDLLKRKPNELSGGQKQRIAIARALIKDSEIILADEPTGNLDSATSEQIFNILKKLSKNKLVVVVSHDEESAKKYADRIIKISDGLIEEDSNSSTIKDNNDFKLVSAKLPFLYSLKMGLGNLFHKKIRLIFSTLLIVLCLVCFGSMISTLNSDVNEEYIKTFEEKGSTEVRIVKYEDNVVYEKIFEEEMKHLFDMDPEFYDNLFPKSVDLDDKFISEVQTKTNMNWYGEYIVYNNFETLSWLYNSSVGDNGILYYYIGDAPIGKYISFIKTNNNLIKGSKIIGNMPTNDDEIMITSYIADQIINNGIKSKTDKNNNKTEVYKPNSYTQMIDDNIYINLGDMMYVKVVGIIDYTDYLNKYSDLKETKAATMWDMSYKSDEYKKLDELYGNLVNDIASFLGRVYVTNEFINKIDQTEENISNSTSKIIYNDKDFVINEFGYINKELDIYVNNGTKKLSNLNNDEIIINTTLLNIITENDYFKKLEEYMILNETDNTSEFLKKYLNDNSIINKKVKTSIKENKIYNDINNFNEYTIVGVINDKSEFSLIYYNKDNIKDLISDNLSMNHIFTQVNTTDELKTILEYYPINNSNILSSSEYSSNLLTSLEISYIFKLAGRYGTIFFLVFAIIILMSFISNSIKFRKKEIGILRAIGCRSIDVIKMFIYECLTLMIVCLGISFVIIPKITNAINSFISSTLYSKMNVMNFGLIQILGVTMIMLIIVILASIIPIRRLTKMKPIDTILDK